VRIGQVMVGDDQIQAQRRAFQLRQRLSSGVDGDDDANALGVCSFKHARLHAVAFAEAVRYVEASFSAEHLDGVLSRTTATVPSTS